MAYTRVNWQNSPSHATPLSAENLNVMDAGIASLETTVGEHTADIQNAQDDISSLQTTVSGHTTSIGTLANLTTTEKSTLVGAINEVNEDVSDVKEDLDDITETVYSDNIFDNDADYTVTEGKYLNPSTGNYGNNADFMVIEDYLTGLEAGEKYWAEYYNKSNNADLGYYTHFICFYDSSKTFISGVQGSQANIPFTVPTNTVYYRVSYPISAYNDRNLTITKGTSKPGAYIPYSVTKKLKIPFTLVDKNGKGDFTSINDAVQALPSGSTILVMPGEYKEQVEAWGKTIHLIGLDKETTILYDDSMDYATPPLEFASGTIKNITIYAKTGSSTPSTTAYAMHVESHTLADSYIYCENVCFRSEVNYCVGAGLRKNSTVTFKNCDFIGSGSGAGSIFFHDADSASYRGTANIIFDTCNMITDGQNYPIKIQALHDNNTTYITFKRNAVWAKTNETNNVFNTWNSGGQTGDGWRNLLKMYLTYDSFGNSVPGMNNH